MKKKLYEKLSVVLAVVLVCSMMIVSFAACGNTPGESGESTENAETSGSTPTATGKFRVGYARVNITPEGDGYPLAGYGRTDKRLSNGFLDYIYATCVAFEDEVGTRMLYLASDLISVKNYRDTMRERLTKALNIPVDNLVLTGSHTHSMVDSGQAAAFNNVKLYMEKVYDAVVQAATEAFADLTESKMYWNTVDLKGYNFVRHYLGDTGMAIGDNHNSSDFWGAGTIVSHASEANNIMYMVRFEREGAKDVLLTNWRAHPTITGGSAKTTISSDYVGAIRSAIEKSEDCLFVYFQGEAGNMNPRTRLGTNVEYNPPTDVKQYGKEIAEKISAVYKSDTWEEIPTGKIHTIHDDYMVDTNHSMDGYVTIARQLYSVYSEYGWTDDLSVMLKENGLYSPYQCGAIQTNSTRALKESLSLHGTAIGDLLISNEESEMFDTNGTFVRDNSPSKFTLIMSYSDGSGYIPSQQAYDYGCYEADTARFAPGSGEVCASRLLEMLNETWKMEH